jgi:hypothetical protein
VAPEVADALARAGVVSLRSLFPEESGKAGRSEATNLLGEPIALVPLDDWFVATLGLDAEVAEVVERVRNTPGVREAFEDDWRYLAHLTPNDALFTQQWGLVMSPAYWTEPECGVDLRGLERHRRDVANGGGSRSCRERLGDTRRS